jgi:elongation factor Ts
MSQISPAAVKALRDRTNAPMMECKAALSEASGDMDKAIELIRKKFAGIQAKRGDRETAEGRIAVHIDPAQKVGVIVEVRCESAPVAKNEHFVQLAEDIAKQIVQKDAKTVEELLAQPFIGDPKKTVYDRIGDVVGLIRENMKPARFVRLSGGLLGSYVHHDGSVGVLLQVEGDKAEDQLLRDICMHITARNPVAARREDVPAAVLAKEREIANEQVAADPKNKSKPANILEKIVEGKIKTWLAENVLVDQPFVKDDAKMVSDVLKGAGVKLTQFIRYRVGERSA